MKADTHMLWFEEQENATPLDAAINAGRYFHKKYGLVPKLVALPQAWADASKAIEQELGLEVIVDKTVLAQHVAVSADKSTS